MRLARLQARPKGALSASESAAIVWLSLALGVAARRVLAISDEPYERAIGVTGQPAANKGNGSLITVPIPLTHRHFDPKYSIYQ